MVWLQDIAPSEFTCFDDHAHSNLSGRFVQSVLSVLFSLVHKLLYKTLREKIDQAKVCDIPPADRHYESHQKDR